VTGHVLLVRFEAPGTIARADWDAFCAEQEIVHAPAAAGGNVYYRGGRMGIECVFGVGTRRAGAEPPEVAESLTFTSAFGGPRRGELAAVAAACWVRFGGSMFADEESRRLICAGALPSA
jgi:hypothetical protein